MRPAAIALNYNVKDIQTYARIYIYIYVKITIKQTSVGLAHAHSNYISSITAPQDAHKRLVMQVAHCFTISVFKGNVRHEFTT